MLTLLQRVETDAEHTGDDLELGVGLTVLVLTYIGGDGLRGNVAELSIGA